MVATAVSMTVVKGIPAVDSRRFFAKVASLTCLGLAMLSMNSVATAIDRSPPTFRIYSETFRDNTDVPNFWQPQTGSWSVSGGTYNGASTPASIAMMYQYPPFPGMPWATDLYDLYDFDVRLLTARNPEGSVGVVFGFQNISTYMEAVFSAAGTMEVRRIDGGVPNLQRRVAFLGFGPGEWIDVKVRRGNVSYTIWVNGTPIAEDQGNWSSRGDVGVIAHDTPVRVDQVFLSIPSSLPLFNEDFSDGIFNHWFQDHQTLGQWSVANGVFNNTSVQQLSFALLGITQHPKGITLRASMLNPYGGPGNQIGFAFNYRPFFGSYHELVFLPNGVAKVNVRSPNGVVQTLASAAYPGRRNEWFDVMVQLTTHLDVTVNGRPLFAGVPPTTDADFLGTMGLLTHWTPGRFDNLRVDPFIAEPLSENFSAGLPQSATTVGSWDTSGGTLNGTSARQTDLVVFGCECWVTNYIYRARLLNQYGASGNLVGLIYSYQEPSGRDYYEVVFAPTGQAYLNKVVSGVRYRMASAAHSVGPNTWFDVELIRNSLSTVFNEGTIETTVKVNGREIFTRVPQGQFGFGRVGVITHWARARFDNLTIKPLARELP